MSGCFAINAGGANTSCANVIGAMKAPLITLASVEWDSLSDAQNTETMRTKIQEDLSVYVTRKITGADITQPEARNETTGFGAQITTGVTPGSVIVYLESNSCDFNEMMAAYSGSNFKVVPYGEDGSYDFHQKDNGKLDGFEAQIYAIPISVAGVENQVQQWKLLINWKNAEQFRKRVRVEAPKSLEGLLEWMPAGMSANVNTIYNTTSGIQVVNVFERCDTSEIETDVLTGEIIKPGTVLAGTVSPSSNSDGTYDVTIQDGTPVNLADGDYLIYRLVKKTGDIYDKISNWIVVNPNA